MPFNIFDGSTWQTAKKVYVNDGSSWQESKAVYVHDGTKWNAVSDLVPKILTAPTLTWSAGAIAQGVGQDVTVSQGTWENTPTSFEYEWFKAPYTGSSSPNWQSVGNSATLTLTADFVGHFLKAQVKAINNYGFTIEIVEITYTVLSPQKLTTLRADLVSNGVFDLVFDKPIGADSWYLQYQGPEVSYTSKYIKPGDAGVSSFIENNKTMYKYRLDTGFASGTLGIGLWPTNSDNPIKNIISHLQGDGKNESILDLKPNRPKVTLLAYSPSIGNGTLWWQIENINQAGYGIWWTGVGNPLIDMTTGVIPQVPGPQTGTSTDRFAYISYLSDGETYGYKVRIYGTADRYTETYWDSNQSVFSVESYPIPVNTAAPVISFTGTTVSCTTGSWTNSPTSYMYVWSVNGSPVWDVFTSSFDAQAYAGSTISCSVSATTANNKTGSANSNSLTVPQPVLPPSGGSVTLTGTGVAGSWITAQSLLSSWSGDPTEVSVIITTKLSPGTPGQNDNIVAFSINSDSCSYQVTSSDAVSPVNRFRAFAIARNSAGPSGTVASGTIDASPYVAPPYFPYFPYFSKSPSFPYFAPPSFPYFPSFTPAPPYFPYFPYFGKGPVPPYFPYFPSFGGGCIAADTLILTPNGPVRADQLSVGDEVYSVKFNELSTDETAYSLATWSSQTMTPIETPNTKVVSSRQVKLADKLVSINGDKFTYEHNILVHNENGYSFAPAGTIQLGWNVLKRNSEGISGLEWVEVTDIHEVNELSWVYLFDTEDQDVLFTTNMLTHNMKAI